LTGIILAFKRIQTDKNRHRYSQTDRQTESIRTNRASHPAGVVTDKVTGEVAEFWNFTKTTDWYTRLDGVTKCTAWI